MKKKSVILRNRSYTCTLEFLRDLCIDDSYINFLDLYQLYNLFVGACMIEGFVLPPICQYYTWTEFMHDWVFNSANNRPNSSSILAGRRTSPIDLQQNMLLAC